MAERKPSPYPRVPVTAKWEASYMTRIKVLTAAKMGVVAENVRLHREVDDLQARLDAVRKIFAPRHDEALARRVVRIVDGQEGRHAGGDRGDVVGGVAGLAGDRGPEDAGGVVAGGGPVPAGGVEPADDAGGDGGVSGAVGSVAAWPYGRTDVA